MYSIILKLLCILCTTIPVFSMEDSNSITERPVCRINKNVLQGAILIYNYYHPKEVNPYYKYMHINKADIPKPDLKITPLPRNYTIRKGLLFKNNPEWFWEDYTLMPCDLSINTFIKKEFCDDEATSEKRLSTIHTSAKETIINRFVLYKNTDLLLKNYQLWTNSTGSIVYIYDFKTHAKKKDFAVEETADFIEAYYAHVSNDCYSIPTWQVLPEGKSWYNAYRPIIQELMQQNALDLFS